MGRVLRVKFGSGEGIVRAPGALRFGEAVIDLAAREICAGGRCVRVEPRAVAVLAEIIGGAGRVIGREALLDACWPAGEGSDEALTQAVAQLRRALGDQVKAPAYIATVSKTGYRWIAAEADPAAVSIESPGRPIWRPGRVAAASIAALALVGAGMIAGGALAPKPPARMRVTQEVYFKGEGPPPLIELRPPPAGGEVRDIQLVRLSPPSPPRRESASPRSR